MGYRVIDAETQELVGGVYETERQAQRAADSYVHMHERSAKVVSEDKLASPDSLPMSDEGFAGVLEEAIVKGWNAQPIYTDDGNTNANIKTAEQMVGYGNWSVRVTLNNGQVFRLRIEEEENNG